jgi:mono/diheme cytochrome c family protein
MNTCRPGGAFAALSLAACLGSGTGAFAADKEDSYYYYGPGGLAKYWNDPKNKNGPAERLGRDTWIHWTWGNQKVIRSATVLAGHLPVPVSIDLFRLLDSRKRATRFRDFGLINEPNCGRRNKADKTEPDYDETILKAYGLYLDKWNGDPKGYYPADKKYREQYGSTYPGTDQQIDDRHYGRPSGIVGLRLFDNPAFNKQRWDVGKYFQNPGKVEPPFLVGFTCGFCHVAFDPLNPPRDPENPRWDNLAANIGNQYFREGELMFGKGRVVFGDKNPDRAVPGDPYLTRGLTEKDFLYHYAVTQQPGTSETSRISYDFINNPNTINPIFGLKYRPKFSETTPWGRLRRTDKDPKKDDGVMHILKDGADALGIEWALMRVPINIGCEGDYWIDHLYRPGRDQRPFRIPEVLAGLPPDQLKAVQKSLGLPTDPETTRQLGVRLAELRTRYRSPYGREEFGSDWQEAWRRAPSLAAYLSSYEPARLKNAAKDDSKPDVAKAAAAALPKEDARLRGARVFGKACARCHSSKRPLPGKDEKEQAAFFLWSPTAPEFLEENFLSEDERHAVTEKGLGTNMARALATNAVDHDIWAEFSSRDYKALSSIAPVTPLVLHVPVFPLDPRRPSAAPAPIRVEFDPPAGGRGYYRTPSLISMWATAPYLHNNSVGDYRVIKDDGSKDWFPNDGAPIGGLGKDGKWVDYQIDVSVEGRLKMFQDGMDKLLNPSRRRRWVKRTSADSALIPDLGVSVRELFASVARDALQQELRAWLKANHVIPEQIEAALRAVGPALDRALRAVLTDAAASLRFGWSAAHLRARDHADRLFDLAFDELKATLPGKIQGRKLPLDRLKLSVRGEFLGRLDRLDRQLRQASLLTVPKGTPVNLYANLGPGKLPYALLAHVRHRDDRQALARALLQMSTCPDFVEDGGHTYGADLSDKEKADLIEFLKTF